jgi:excisionase family DNA binding protein
MNGKTARKRLTLTVDETAEVLGISRWLAYALVRRGEIPSVRLGNRVVVPIARLQAMLAGEEAEAIS